MTPHVAGCAEAVQHDDRWTMSADAYVDLGAVGFDLTRLHAGREGVDAVLMSDVVHRFTPPLKGTGPLSASRSGRPVAPVDLPGRCPGPGLLHEVDVVRDAAGPACADGDEDAFVEPRQLGGGGLDAHRGAERVLGGVDVLAGGQAREHVRVAVAYAVRLDVQQCPVV